MPAYSSGRDGIHPRSVRFGRADASLGEGPIRWRTACARRGRFRVAPRPYHAGGDTRRTCCCSDWLGAVAPATMGSIRNRGCGVGALVRAASIEAAFHRLNDRKTNRGPSHAQLRPPHSNWYSPRRSCRQPPRSCTCRARVFDFRAPARDHRPGDAGRCPWRAPKAHTGCTVRCARKRSAARQGGATAVDFLRAQPGAHRSRSGR